MVVYCAEVLRKCTRPWSFCGKTMKLQLHMSPKDFLLSFTKLKKRLGENGYIFKVSFEITVWSISSTIAFYILFVSRRFKISDFHSCGTKLEVSCSAAISHLCNYACGHFSLHSIHHWFIKGHSNNCHLMPVVTWTLVLAHHPAVWPALSLFLCVFQVCRLALPLCYPPRWWLYR